MPRGTKPGAVRGHYRKHTRTRKVSAELAARIRAAPTFEAAWALALHVSGSTIRMIRGGQRKQPIA